jgi:hypothetical protein
LANNIPIPTILLTVGRDVDLDVLEQVLLAVLKHPPNVIY